MLAIDDCVTPELLEVALERVQNDIDTAEPGNPSLGQIRDFSRSSSLKQWALGCAADLLVVNGSSDMAQAMLGLLTAGILVGMELQRLASQVGDLEAWYSHGGIPGAAEFGGRELRTPRPAARLERYLSTNVEGEGDAE